jgi:septal ring factor EnvC (AmiA/AmiB activator)
MTLCVGGVSHTDVLEARLSAEAEVNGKHRAEVQMLQTEIRRTFVDLDEIEKELKKAGTAIEKAKTMTAKYHTRLSGLCDGADQGKKPPATSGDAFGTSVATGD